MALFMPIDRRSFLIGGGAAALMFSSPSLSAREPIFLDIDHDLFGLDIEAACRERGLAIGRYTHLVVAIGEHVTIRSPSEGRPAVVTGFRRHDDVAITLVNNGRILGAGAIDARRSPNNGKYAVTAPAIHASVPMSVKNTGMIVGGCQAFRSPRDRDHRPSRDRV